MTAAPYPQPGAIVEISRPGAFTRQMEIWEKPDCQPPPWDGWQWLRGVWTDAPASRWGSAADIVGARLVEDGHWQMVPYDPLPPPGPELGSRNAEILRKRLGR